MAKEQFSQEDIKDIKEYRDLLKSTQAEWTAINKELAKYKYVTNQTKEDLKNKLKALVNEYGTYKDIISELKKYENLVKKIEQEQEKKLKNLEKEKDLQEDIEEITKNQLINFDELDELQRSITSEYKRQYIDAGAIEKKIDSTKALVGGINTFLEKNTDIQGRQKELIEEAADQYKNMPISVADLKRQLKSGSITQKEYNKALYEMSDTFEETISKIDKNDERLKGILETLEKMKEETNAFGTAMGKTSEAGELFFDKTFGAMPGGIGELSNSIKEAKKEFKETGTLSDLTLAGGAYLAARAKFYAGNAFGMVNPTGAQPIPESNDSNPLIQLSSQLKYLDALSDKYNTLASASEKFYMNNSGLTKLFAEFDFQTQVQLARKEFEKTSKTAFFGSGLGSVKYAADQLQMAGIGADVIVSTMSEMTTGANSGIQGLSEDVAVFSKKTGIAASELSGITGLFRMLDKTGGADAFKDLTSSLSAADLDKFNIADISGELANSSEMALLANIKSGKELVKQVRNVREMGGSFVKIAEAGKSMVLNYKDSIKKEMELSAMLGENVDLSEARALFAAGKDDEGFKSLKDSGILEKAQAQGIFAVDLVNSLFPAQQLAKQPLEKGASAGIKSNEDFLKTLQNSLKDFEIGSAIINVQRAGLRELLQFAPGNKGDESVNQQLAKLRENAFSDAISTLVDIQKFALREGKIIGEVPVLGPPLKSALDLIEQPSGINNPYITGKFPKNNDKLFGTTPFLNQTNPQGTPAEQKERLKKAIEEIKNSMPKGGVIKGSTFDFNMSEVISQPLKISNTSLKSIDVQSTTQTGLLQNLQTIMATLANFTDPTFGLKLLIDGKDVKSRIEKIKIQEKGKTK
jgi:hypothetical protein